MYYDFGVTRSFLSLASSCTLLRYPSRSFSFSLFRFLYVTSVVGKRVERVVGSTWAMRRVDSFRNEDGEDGGREEYRGIKGDGRNGTEKQKIRAADIHK